MPRHSHPRTRRARTARPPWPLIAALSAALLVTALAAVLLAQRGPASAASTFSAVTDCRGFPQFTPGYGFTGGVVISTSVPDRQGLVLLDPAQPGRGFQHPSWTKAGDLGPFAVDQDGTIYVGPAPKINIAANPLAGVNTLWRVDTMSAEMTPWLTLPAAVAPSERNPFGVTGLAFDCDTGSLYAASVAGSGPASEVGRLFQIAVATQQVVSQLDGIDALGIVVARTPAGRRLFYGAAREGLIASIGLDERGAFTGEPRREIDLADLGGDVQEKARRIDISGDRLDVTVVPFTFTLAPKPSRHIFARYDPATKAWVPAGAPAMPAP